MNRGEFEGLKHRFGSDTESWPAPFRREALSFLALDRHHASGEEEMLARLVLEAAVGPTDERALARKVMARIAQPRLPTFGMAIDLGSWSLPATAASIAFVLTVSAVGGYVAAGGETETSDNALMAFAVGLPPSELAESMAVPQSSGGHL